jgi:A/G-specific adenine glycosylase
MLQQTQVSRVEEEYFPRFLKRFPTLHSLSQAPLDDVLALWSGLGYYRRAKNLHSCAQLTQGRLPSTLIELKKLPGIGDYTASAICSFALEIPTPVVDTNIARVLKRYFALLEVKDKKVWEYAESFLNTENSRAHNLALMDLGSMICTPKNPSCRECPLFESCLGKEEAELYTKVKKKEYISMELYFGVFIKDDKIALTYSEDNMYKDMLVLPRVEPIEDDFLGSFKHSYTKYKLDVKLYEIEDTLSHTVWVNLDEFERAPISSLTKKAKKFFLLKR